jgi:large subunit ribosomal protein L4
VSVPVLNAEGLPAGEAAFSGPVAEQTIKPHLIHETVVAELGHRRAGTHSTKNRGEVRGGGKKPWRQKGTGRARQGSIRAPHWRGGGVTFGPTPRSHGGKVNRKVRAQAFRAALRAHADRGSMAVMDPTGWDTPSSKRAAAYLFQAPEGIAARPLLVVVDDPDGIEGLSFRNLEGVYVLPASELEVVDVMAGRSLLIERAVWERFTGGELTVAEVAVTPKALPERTPPPAPKPITRTPKKKDDDKPKRSRKKADADEGDEAVVAADVDETTSEVAVEDKPKRARKKAEPADDAPGTEAAGEGDEAVAEAAVAETKSTAKAAKTTGEADAETDAEAEADEKPKRTRKKAEPAAGADADADVTDTPVEDGAE